MPRITPQEALQRTIEHREIFHDEMLELMRQIMRGELSPVMTASILTGLRVKKETIGEISAAAEVMREFSNKVHVHDRTHLVDIVGTGGDGANTFNISTCATFVIAAAGGKVSKHGGRSVSSKSGSADAMEALGVNIMLAPEQIADCIRDVGIGFMFAPNHHPAMKNVAPVRKELGVRTIFNILGPLTNPASAPNILMGVFHEDLVGIQVRALQPAHGRHARAEGGDARGIQGHADGRAAGRTGPGARHRLPERRRGAVRSECGGVDRRRPAACPGRAGQRRSTSEIEAAGGLQRRVDGLSCVAAVLLLVVHPARR